MASEPSDTHPYRARDGLYYDSYESMRDANVRLNQQKLREMGLDRPSPWRKKKENRRPSTSRQAGDNNDNSSNNSNQNNNSTGGAKRKKSMTLTTDDTSSSTSVEPLRRSERTPRQVAYLSPDQDVHHRPKKQIKTVAERVKKTALRNNKKDEWDSPILEALRQNLKEKAAGDTTWFTQFLRYWQHQISPQNFRTIKRQVEKLMSGQGITYRHWPENVCFHAGQSIDMSMDLDSLYQLARRYEAEYGPDLGKGWLIRIPLSKLCTFQQYYFQQMLYRQANEGKEMPPARYPIGTRFEKEFPGFGIFKGRVKAFDGTLYRVMYEDGDFEDMTEEELSKLNILTALPTPSQKDPAKNDTLLTVTATAGMQQTQSANNHYDDGKPKPQPTPYTTRTTTTTNPRTMTTTKLDSLVPPETQFNNNKQELEAPMMGDTNNSNNNNNNNHNQPRYPVGTVFAKIFPGHGCYVGRVTAFDGQYYKVYYAYDNDEEDFEEADFANVTILKKQV